MHRDDILTGYVMDGACLTLEELCAVCSVEPVWVIRHVEEGLLNPVMGEQAGWRFSSASLARTRRLYALERDFDAVPELAALMADLLEELDTLRARMPHHRV